MAFFERVKKTFHQVIDDFLIDKPCPRWNLRRGLFDLGMDSLMSVELKSRLEATVGQPLPTTLTFKYPTVAVLTDFLARELGVETVAAGPTTAMA